MKYIWKLMFRIEDQYEPMIAPTYNISVKNC